ncbi:MAG: T9SS type A sorting domain-containing protein, partial [Ignavibacteriales bacterium]|nr:T9SS type A sorting domain-containing protein [Ignavibacteriales bacterium]
VRAIADVPFLYRDTTVRPLRMTSSEIAGRYPYRFELEQNYPNPFNPTTNIIFSLPEPSFVTLKIYNVLGQEVKMVYDREMLEEGTNDVEFTAGFLPSGVYFYKLVAEGIGDEENPITIYSDVRKMLLVK